MRFIPAVSLVRIQLPLPLRPGGQAVKTPPFHGGNTSSILVRVTIFGRIAQLVRALASHARGQRFESVYAHQKKREAIASLFFSIDTEGREPQVRLVSAKNARRKNPAGGLVLFFAFRFFFEFEAEHRNIVKLRGFPDERVDIRFDRRQQVGGGGVGVFR